MKRSRLVVLLVSAPIVALLIVGGVLSHAAARDSVFQHLRVFEDVVSLVINNYVEEVDTKQLMRGAMHGLAEGLDPVSSYLTPEQVTALETGETLPRGDVGLTLTRQYYLRIVAAREGSPAARAGLRPDDYIRSIDGEPTRDMSVFTGMRLLRGAPGTRVKLTVIRGNAAEPHEVVLVREEPKPLVPTARLLREGLALVRVPAFGDNTAAQLLQRFKALNEQRVKHVLIDLRGTAEGPVESGIAAARLFVAEGVLGAHQSRTSKSPITARSGDGSISVPLTLLVDRGTAGAAELFAAALSGNGRATLVGERTNGLAGMQELVKLPDGSGLWLTTSRYLTPKDAPIHDKGLTPDTEVDAPEMEFGEAPPARDPILEKAIEQAAQGLPKAA
ncbi:MAG TPA: S41 family peptidase [Vicinamibacterales bacterium]|nr:S41 family peptidase [Vicinamibacterales bacterium]